MLAPKSVFWISDETHKARATRNLCARTPDPRIEIRALFCRMGPTARATWALVEGAWRPWSELSSHRALPRLLVSGLVLALGLLGLVWWSRKGMRGIRPSPLLQALSPFGPDTPLLGLVLTAFPAAGLAEKAARVASAVWRRKCGLIIDPRLLSSNATSDPEGLKRKCGRADFCGRLSPPTRPGLFPFKLRRCNTP